MGKDMQLEAWREVAKPFWDSRFEVMRMHARQVEEAIAVWSETEEARRLIGEAAELIRQAVDLEEEAARKKGE